jgi:predicted CXXCH cytochrome family protein
MRFALGCRLGYWSLFLLAIPLAGADIRDTPHNLARTSVTSEVEASATCVFCHTPLVSGGGPDALPAWQSGLPRSFSYGALEPISSQAGREAGPPSLMCLSCHDANLARATDNPKQDHPFSVPFRGGTGVLQASVPTGGVSVSDYLRSADPGQAPEYREPSSVSMNDRMVWWVSTGGGARRSRTDLPLYGRITANGSEIPYIECASCHDPHSNNLLFLRQSSNGSRLCLSCHIL